MPKIVDQEAYRRELVAGATRLFSESGFGSVTMRQVAKAIGVSTGTLYHYFPSKHKLFEAVVWARVEDNLADALDALQAEEGLQITVRELFGFMLMAEETLMHQFVVLIDFWRLGEAQREAFRPMLYEAHLRYTGTVESLLGIEDRGLAEMTISVLFNFLELRWLHGETFDYEPQLAILERMVEGAKVT